MPRVQISGIEICAHLTFEPVIFSSIPERCIGVKIQSIIRKRQYSKDNQVVKDLTDTNTENTFENQDIQIQLQELKVGDVLYKIDKQNVKTSQFDFVSKQLKTLLDELKCKEKEKEKGKSITTLVFHRSTSSLLNTTTTTTSSNCEILKVDKTRTFLQQEHHRISPLSKDDDEEKQLGLPFFSTMNSNQLTKSNNVLPYFEYEEKQWNHLLNTTQQTMIEPSSASASASYTTSTKSNKTDSKERETEKTYLSSSKNKNNFQSSLLSSSLLSTQSQSYYKTPISNSHINYFISPITSSSSSSSPSSLNFSNRTTTRPTLPSTSKTNQSSSMNSCYMTPLIFSTSDDDDSSKPSSPSSVQQIMSRPTTEDGIELEKISFHYLQNCESVSELENIIQELDKEDYCNDDTNNNKSSSCCCTVSFMSDKSSRSKKYPSLLQVARERLNEILHEVVKSPSLSKSKLQQKNEIITIQRSSEKMQSDDSLSNKSILKEQQQQQNTSVRQHPTSMSTNIMHSPVIENVGSIKTRLSDEKANFDTPITIISEEDNDEDNSDDEYYHLNTTNNPNEISNDVHTHIYNILSSIEHLSKHESHSAQCLIHQALGAHSYYTSYLQKDTNLLMKEYSDMEIDLSSEILVLTSRISELESELERRVSPISNQSL